MPEDYLETQGKINLDDLLSHRFDMNNGLSCFNLDDLGDFTIEYAFYSSNGFGS